MTRMTLEEAEAFGLETKQLTEQDILVKGALTGLRKRVGDKWATLPVKKAKKKNKNVEDTHAEQLANWLKARKYKFMHTPNESWMWWKFAMIISMKKKRMWLAPGFPDYMIFLKNGWTLYIELKKPRTYKQNWEYKALSSDWISCSDAQKEWIEYLNTRKWHIAKFCFGFDESILFITNTEQWILE